MRQELMFWFAVGLVAIVALAGFKIVATNPAVAEKVPGLPALAHALFA